MRIQLLTRGLEAIKILVFETGYQIADNLAALRTL